MKTLKQIREQYTLVRQLGDKDEGWATYLVIDQQSFCVVEDTTEKRAKWFAKQLAIALKRLIEKNQK